MNELPPFIFIRFVEIFPSTCLGLIELIGIDNFHCKLTSYRLRFQAVSSESYRALVHYLGDTNAEFYTSQLISFQIVITSIQTLQQTYLIENSKCVYVKSKKSPKLFIESKNTSFTFFH